MPAVGETITREAVRKEDVRNVRKTAVSTRRRKVVDPERKHGRRKVRKDGEEGGDYQAVYEDCNRGQGVEAREDDVEEKDTDEDDDGDTRLKAPSESKRQTIDRRTKGGNTRRSSGQDAAVEKQRDAYRRRQSEPIEPTQRAPQKLHGIDECKPASPKR